jgi:hypothetical protein
MTLLSTFGLFAVTAMLITYALGEVRPWRSHSPACLARRMAVLKGRGHSLVEAAWSRIALRRWWLRKIEQHTR